MLVLDPVDLAIDTGENCLGQNQQNSPSSLWYSCWMYSEQKGSSYNAMEELRRISVIFLYVKNSVFRNTQHFLKIPIYIGWETVFMLLVQVRHTGPKIWFMYSQKWTCTVFFRICQVHVSVSYLCIPRIGLPLATAK